MDRRDGGSGRRGGFGGDRHDDGGAPRRSSAGRVPPHNLQAEESVLGAVLLSRDAIGAVSEQGLHPEDFYRPAHQHIYDAVRALYATGAPADTITVADELRRAGLLEQIGGTEVLHALQNATPAISNAAHYARIVQDTSLLRRLIHVAGDIAEMAYSEPDDVTKAVDDAESKVFKVAEDRVTDSTQLLSESIKSVMDRLEETYARGDSITGTATGFHDIDELLSGLQPSTLNIVGARPAMGKCVAWDTPMVDVASGEVVTARELADRAASRGALEVRGLDALGRQATMAVSACIEDGVKPVFRLRTKTGRTATITASHPLLTTQGWRPLGELAVGDEIAVPAALPVFGADAASDDELDRMATAAVSGAGLRPAAFRLSRPALTGLVARLFAANGAVRAEGSSASIRFSAGAESLALAVGHALLRLGVRSSYHRHRAPDGSPRHDIEVTEPASLIRFADDIGVPGRDEVVARARAAAARACHQRRLLPVAVWDDIDKARGAVPWPELNERLGRRGDDRWHEQRARVARETVALLADVLDDDQLRWWASPDVEWEPIVAIVPAGATEVIDFTVPGQHNFVAADLYLHNTAFGLGMAVHVAQTTAKPVLVFSLEMGHNELTQRILSSEARVDSSKMRNGRISEADWGLIGRAIGRLEVPLFLDDNPRVTVMEIRAKARRLKARHGGLALIVIDYLQLMSGNGNPENRQLEVSEISRSLKILARELEVPIVALSQLSRNLEARSDKRPMLSDLRESGCLTADTRLVRADTNEEVTLGELVERDVTDIPLWSLDEHYRLVPARLLRAFPSGTKETFRIRFASGRTIDASANHPFLTVEGWSPVEGLSIGDHLATARRLPSGQQQATMTESELVLLGHLIGDGCTLDRHAIQYTTTDPANVAAVVEAAACFGVQARVKAERTWTQVYLPSPVRLTHGRHHPLSTWLRRLGVWNLRSWEKHVPAEVFGQPPASIATFLRHLWATDGSVVVCASSPPRIYYATSSRRLADDVVSLLLRLDIRGRIRVVHHARGRTGFHVDVSGRDDQLRFASIVDVHGARGAILDRLVQTLDERRSGTNVDIVPKTVWEHVRRKVLPELGMTARELAAGLGMQYCGSALYKSGVSRARLQRLVDVTGDPWLRDLATSDVLWDRIVEITPLGPQPVFDATISSTHNFVANGVIAHNSLEQDADVVMFLYRDEVYNAESPDKGSAEIIVAKHRSGPIGTKRLVYLGQYTRFDNAARGV